MASKVQLDYDYEKTTNEVHDGLFMLRCYESVADHLPKVKAMEIRDDDILLCTYPKSGTHWSFRIIDMIIRNRVEYDSRTADSTFLDLQRIERLPELDSPRILNTHIPFERLPEQVKSKRTKIVHVYRNPKAVLVSLFFQTKNGIFDIPNKEHITLERMAAKFFTENALYHGWAGYVDRVTAFQKENPDLPIIHVAYEDLSLKPVETIRKLAKDLGKDVSDDFCQQVANACSFNSQKKEEEKKNTGQIGGQFYRKGDMNDWKNYLTVATSEQIDQLLRERKDRCPFSARYVD